jgi:hypothetical protein
MSQTINPTTTIATFVIRFWRETIAGESRWRGCIEHVQSGKSAAFLEIDAMLFFMRSFGITVEDPLQRTQEEV